MERNVMLMLQEGGEGAKILILLNSYHGGDWSFNPFKAQPLFN
jgi:hypothetical protein